MLESLKTGWNKTKNGVKKGWGATKSGVKKGWNATKTFYNDFSENLENSLAERLSASGKTDLSIWDGYKAFFQESFDVSNKNVFEPVKKPIKDGAKKLDTFIKSKIDDGNPENMTIAEKAWNGFKGVGKMADKMISAEGAVAVGATVLTGGAALGAMPTGAAAATGGALTYGSAAVGTGFVGKGAYDVATAKNEQEAQEGGEKIGMGAMMITPSAIKGTVKGIKSVKNSMSSTKNATPAKNVETLPTETKMAMETPIKDPIYENTPSIKNSTNQTPSIKNEAKTVKTSGSQKIMPKETPKIKVGSRDIEAVPIKTKDGTAYVPKYSSSPEFQQLATKINGINTTGEQRIKDITNELLEFMGYPKNSVNFKINGIKNNGSTQMAYCPNENAILLKSAEDINKLSNSDVASKLFHELTHMDNAAKLIKKMGLKKYMEYSQEKNMNSFMKKLLDKGDRKDMVEKAISEIKNTKGTNIEDMSKYADISNEQYISNLMKENTYRTIGDKDLLSKALNDYHYYNSFDEVSAFHAGNQFEYTATGKISNKSGLSRTLANKARNVAEKRAEKLFGTKDIEKLDLMQQAELQISLEDDINYIFSKLLNNKDIITKLRKANNPELIKQYNMLRLPYKTASKADRVLWFLKLKQNNPEYVESFLEAIKKLPD